MDKLGWLPIGFVGLIIIMVLTNRIATIRLRKKLAKAWEGKPFFIKNDSEESLVETMLLASTLQPTDSQVDDQTWHDLDMHRVFDQLNYTQSSIGAEALYQKMRLINFQPDASLQELEDFFEHHPDFRLKVQVVMNQLGKYKVRDVMRTEFPIIHQDTQVEDVLNELVDESFICIGNDEDEFVGIVTRKELLKRINFMVHELTREYDFVEKENSK